MGPAGKRTMNQSHPGRIGKYELLGPLGQGAMGVVYRARDPEIGRTVAIKTLGALPANRLDEADTILAQFRNEARSAGNLRHRNIITIFEVNRDGEMPYLVMDLVEGRSLEEILKRSGRLDAQWALHLLLQVASALDYAHDRGVVHRDIKPGNILVDAADNVFVLDFGIASISERISTSSDDAAGPVVGSPAYMAPERIMNEPVDHRADIFSLAVVAYECFTGVRPFAGQSITGVFEQVLAGTVTPLTAVAPDLPRALQDEFARAFARRPEDRFASAGALITALAGGLGLEPRRGIGGGMLVPRERKLTGWRPERLSGQAASAGETGPLSRRSQPELRPGLSARVLFLGLGGLVLVGGLFAILLPTGSGRRSGSGGEVLSSASSEVAPPAAPREPQPASAGDESRDAELIAIIRDPARPEGEVIEALRRAAERRLEALAEAAEVPLQSDSYLVRVEAIKALALVNEPAVVAPLLGVLDDYDPLVRGHAARALGGVGDRRALAYLTARYSREDSKEVRAVLRKSIERISGVPFTGQ